MKKETAVYCFRCGTKLEKETDKELKKDYPFFCPTCDENMFLFESFSADALMFMYLPSDINFTEIFADKNLNHYIYKEAGGTIRIFNDKYLFDAENKYEYELSRAEFKHSSYNKPLYFIIDERH